MVGLTREQMRLLNEWSKGLWVLLDQSDFDNIQKISQNAVGRQTEVEVDDEQIQEGLNDEIN